MQRVARTRVRVRYADTDGMGVTYHANYLVWFEVGRTELMREAGSSYRNVEAAGISLPVIRGDYALHAPAVYDDELAVETRIVEIRTRRIVFEYAIHRGSTLIATGSTTHAPVARDGQVVVLPAEVRERLSPFVLPSARPRAAS